MNISAVIDFINRERGANISGAYYRHVQAWLDWWAGFYKPFHSFTELGVDGKRIHRKLYTMKMAKKVCEDWAAILLNDKTTIIIDDKTSSRYLQGDDGTGGVLGENQFWQRGNEFIETTFASGTGATVLRVQGMKVSEGRVQPGEGCIELDFLPALYVIPITVRKGQIIDAAFASEVLENGEKYIYLETHILEGKEYTITNRYFKIENGALEEQTLPPGIAPVVHTGSDIPWFSILRPNIVNNVDPFAAMGVSVFANAIDNLMGVDLAFNNFCRDFKLGGKKVFYNKSLTKTDQDGNTITPDDVAQQLFTVVGDELLTADDNTLIHEFNPAIRVQENTDGLQAQLDYLSFKCGFGTKHYQFNAGSIVTATQYNGDKQELIQNAAKHYIAVETYIKSLVRSILWIGKNICGEPVDPDTLVKVNFEDSYIIDKESERLRDQQEARDGLMQKWEYRVKWYGEDEATAKNMAGAERSDNEYMGFGGES